MNLIVPFCIFMILIIILHIREPTKSATSVRIWQKCQVSWFKNIHFCSCYIYIYIQLTMFGVVFSYYLFYIYYNWSTVHILCLSIPFSLTTDHCCSSIGKKVIIHLQTSTSFNKFIKREKILILSIFSLFLIKLVQHTKLYTNYIPILLL